MIQKEGEPLHFPQDVKPFYTPPEKLKPKPPVITPMIPLRRRIIIIRRSKRYRKDPFIPTERPRREAA